MSLQIRIQDLITAVGTDIKQLRVWITGSSSGDLTGLTTTAKNSIVAAINELNAKVYTAASASETVEGILKIATQADTDGGTNDAKAVTPLKLATRLQAYAQPLSANLTTLAGVVSGSFGRTLLQSTDAASAKTSLGLAAIATSGSASDLTTGTLPASVLPPLAISDVFPVASQAAMLALTAQRGDVAIRSDVNKTYILASDTPTNLADWKQLPNVDDLALKIANNLSDLNNVATARTNLSVYSKTELGDPETDLVAEYTQAKA